MRWRRAMSVTAMVACVIGAGTASAAASSSNVATASSSAAARTANAADIEFVRMMIPHHYQALVMSRLAPERSSDEQVLAMAERIDTAQSVEIDAMRGWQGRNGLEVTDAEESYQQVLQDPALLEQMGMATPEELEDLRAAQGAAFDVLFLQLMIPHHEGAIRMAEEVAGNGSDVFVRQLAIDIISTQNRQIYDMRQILERKTA